MAQPPHRRTSTYVAGGIVLAIIVLALLWDWNWFKPLVEHEASSALGRSVTLQHFDVKMRWHPWFIADSIAIANPPEFPDDSHLATTERLAIRPNPWAWFVGRMSPLARKTAV